MAGEENLLETLDGLIGRVDAKREPVSGDEVLQVVQRRLFEELGEPSIRQQVAREYAAQLESFLTQNAQSDGERRQAREQASELKRRIVDAYPFHPDLLELMYHRWGSLPSYQRTRGALQFLATVVGAIRRQGTAGALISPGDVPFEDPQVRSTFFTQIGEREAIDDELRKIEPTEAAKEVAEQLGRALGDRDLGVIWPKDSAAVNDRRPRFQIAFLGPEHALETEETLERLALDWSENCGRAKREFRNALALALPNATAMDNARLAARRIIAIQRLLDDRRLHGFEDDDRHELEDRKKRSATELQAAVRQLYDRLLLPVAAPAAAGAPVRLERLAILRHQALGAGIVDGILRALENWVFGEAVPAKLLSCTQLGREDLGARGHWLAGPTIVQQFFGSVQFPKLLSLEGLRKTIAKGVAAGTFGLVIGASDDGEQLRPFGRETLSFKVPIEPDDVDLGEGSYLISARLARELEARWARPDDLPTTVQPGEDTYPKPVDPIPSEVRQPPASYGEPPTLRLTLRTDRKKLYKAFNALQWLTQWADRSFEAVIDITAHGAQPIDRNAYEMSVLMPLEEAEISYREGE